MKKDKIDLSILFEEYKEINTYHYLMPLQEEAFKLEKQIEEEQKIRVENKIDWSLLIASCFLGPLLLLNGAVLGDDDELNTKGNWKSIKIGNMIFFVGLIIILSRD